MRSALLLLLTTLLSCTPPVRDRPSLYADVAVPTCTPRRASAPVVGKAINANVFAPATDGLSDSERVVRAFEALDDLGVDTIRVDFAWRYIEQQPDVFSWDVIDEIVAAAHARDITVLAILGYAPD